MCSGIGYDQAYIDVLTLDDFEPARGNHTDCKRDCRLYTDTHAHQGHSAANIQDSSVTSSPFYHTNGIEVHTSDNTQINVEFWFKAVRSDVWSQLRKKQLY